MYESQVNSWLKQTLRTSKSTDSSFASQSVTAAITIAASSFICFKAWPASALSESRIPSQLSGWDTHCGAHDQPRWDTMRTNKSKNSFPSFFFSDFSFSEQGVSSKESLFITQRSDMLAKIFAKTTATPLFAQEACCFQRGTASFSMFRGELLAGVFLQSRPWAQAQTMTWANV